jgi:hypothetical protein
MTFPHCLDHRDETCHSHPFLVHLLRVENAAKGKENVIGKFLAVPYAPGKPATFCN